MLLFDAIVATPGRTNLARKTHVYAETSQDARRELLEKGFRVLSVERNLTGPNRLWYTGKDQKLAFLRTLGFQSQAGNSPSAALAHCIETEPDPGFRDELQPALDILNAGGGFTEALRATDTFDEITLTILQAGEAGGSLKRVMSEAIDYMERRRKDMMKIYGPLAWFGFEIFQAVSTVVYAKYTFVPDVRLRGIESKKQEEIDAFNFALNTSDAIIDVLFWLAIVVSGLGISAITAAQTPSLRRKLPIGRWLDKVPHVGAYRVNSAISVTFGAAARLIRSGKGISDAVEIVSRSTAVETVRRYWDAVNDRLENRGDSSQEAFLMPPLDVHERQHLKGHKNKGDLAKVMTTIADEREAKLDGNIRKGVRLMHIVTYSYIGAVFTVMIWLMMAQNKSMMAGMSSITNPGGS